MSTINIITDADGNVILLSDGSIVGLETQQDTPAAVSSNSTPTK